jgi:hypothetical protein
MMENSALGGGDHSLRELNRFEASRSASAKCKEAKVVDSLDSQLSISSGCAAVMTMIGGNSY